MLNNNVKLIIIILLFIDEWMGYQINLVETEHFERTYTDTPSDYSPKFLKK